MSFIHRERRQEFTGIPIAISQMDDIPVGNYMFNVNNRNTRTRCEICSKLTIKTPDRADFEQENANWDSGYLTA